MCKQHNERQYEAPPDDASIASIRVVVLCPEIRVPRNLAQLLRLVTQDFGSICLTEEEVRRRLYQKIKYGRDPENPTPVDFVDHVGTHDRCYRRADEGEHAVDGLSLASFFFAPAVSQHTIA